KDNLSRLQATIKLVTFLATAILLSHATAREPSAKSDKKKVTPPDLAWHAVNPDDVVGKGWKDTKAPFDRLPARAEKIVRPPIWELSRHSAGLYVDCATDAKSISARCTLTSDRLAMPHMAATGVSGLDLYIKNDEGRWQRLAGRQPAQANNTDQRA